MTTRILVGDDHPMVQSALRTAFAVALPEAEIIACRTLDEVLATLARDAAAIDLVLLDLNMPGAQGFSGLFLLLAQFPTIPAAIISAQEDAATIRRAIAYGASGFLPKSLSLPAMADAVRSILAGEIWTPTELADPADGAREDRAIAGRLASLSPQQMRILMMIVGGKLNKQIAGELGIAEQTVKVHVSTILRKLEVRSRTQAAVLVQATYGGLPERS